MSFEARRHGAFDDLAVTLPASPASAGAARRVVRRLLPGTASADQCSTVELLTSELVANAVVHAGTPCRLRLSYPCEDRVRVEVTDYAEGSPTVQPGAPTDPGGRGLQLVAAAAIDWGTARPAQDRKTVWFEAELL